MTAVHEQLRTDSRTQLTADQPGAGVGRPVHGRDHAVPRAGPRDHALAQHRQRTSLEDECIAKGVDPLQVDRIRKRLAGALDEGYEMCEAMGAAPGAKWGDLTTAIYTAAGDVTYLSCHGVIAFSAILHHPIRYIMKYWKDEPTVGIHEGDGFIHNDARYGNIHNTDQSMIMPVIRDGQIIAWVAATIHEGENGACEPGGMPSGSETPFDDGLRMSPFKIVEHGHLRRDLLTFLQHSVRDPKLQLADLKVKIGAVRRIMERIDAPDRRGRCRDLRRGTARHGRGRRRGGAPPDRRAAGRHRALQPVHGLDAEGEHPHQARLQDHRQGRQDDRRPARHRSGDPQPGHQLAAVLGQVDDDAGDPGVLVAGPAAVHLGDELHRDHLRRGHLGRRRRTTHRWASPCRRRSVASRPCRRSRRRCSSPRRRSTPTWSRNWFNQINTFLWGGVTQHGDQVGNLCADLNGMPGGAKPFRDGEDAVSPLFCAMADTAEQEVMEEEVPFMQLVAKRLVRDNMGFGKFTGGMGYEMIVATEGTPLWGFMTVTSGAKFSSIYGMFGGYGCGTYPLAMVKGVNVYDAIRKDPEQVRPVDGEGHERAALRGRPVHRRATWVCSSTSPRTASCT